MQLMLRSYHMLQLLVDMEIFFSSVLLRSLWTIATNIRKALQDYPH